MRKVNILLGGMVIGAAFAAATTAASWPVSGPQTQGGDKASKSQVTSDPKQDVDGVAYKVSLSMRVRREHNKLILLLSIGPENFTRDRMLMLARQLNNDFSGEARIYAVIFDSEAAARNYDPSGGSYYVSKKLERGEYYLDRVKGLESLNFSSRRGSPVNEMKLSLGDKGVPVKKRKRVSR